MQRDACTLEETEMKKNSEILSDLFRSESTKQAASKLCTLLLLIFNAFLPSAVYSILMRTEVSHSIVCIPLLLFLNKYIFDQKFIQRHILHHGK